MSRAEAEQQVAAAIEALTLAVSEIGFEGVDDALTGLEDEVGGDDKWIKLLIDQVRSAITVTAALRAGRSVLRHDKSDGSRVTFDGDAQNGEFEALMRDVIHEFARRRGDEAELTV